MGLKILHINNSFGFGSGNLKTRTKFYRAYLSEIIAPDEMIGDVMLGKPIGGSIVKATVCLNSYGISKKRYVGKYLPVEFKVARSIST